MGSTPGDEGARITIRRLVEFADTDQSGHYHNASVIRWIEAAEAVLHARLGIVDRTFGFMPRVRLEIDFGARLWFLDEIDISFGVAHIGRTSLRYRFEVRRGDVVAAHGIATAVYLPQGADRAQPWPEDLRRLFVSAGDRSEG